MKITREFLEKLPKTDLHVHLDGSLRISTIFDLAKKQNVELPAKTEEELKKELTNSQLMLFHKLVSNTQGIRYNVKRKAFEVE